MFRSTISAALALTLLHSFPAAAVEDEAAVIVTGTRFADTFLRKPLNVTVITADEIRQSGTTTLPDLLAQKAGVAVRDFLGNNGAYAAVDIRGFGSTAGQNTLILLDGRRLTDMDSAYVQWASIPAEAIERIEILRGSGAVLYGDNASAGVINIITRSPARGQDQATLSVRTGSYGTSDAQVFANRFSDRFGFTLALGRLETDGYRDNNRTRQESADAKLQWVYDHGQIMAWIGADRLDMRLPGPRRVDWNTGLDLVQTDRRGTATPNDDSRRNGDRLGLEWRHRFSFGELTADFTHRERDQWIFAAAFGGRFRGSSLTLDALSPRLRIDHGAPGGRGSLVVGADWQGWRLSFADAQNQSLAGMPWGSVNATQRNEALYVQETADVNSQLSVLAGWRQEKQRLTARNHVDPAAPGWDFAAAATPQEMESTQRAVELGVRYQLADAWSLTGKLARAYRFANIDEIFEYDSTFNNSFQFLRPQTNRLKEIALHWRTRRAGLKAALFRNDVTDEIHLDPFTSGVGSTNLPPSRRDGLEIEADWRPAERIRLDLAYTYTDARFREGVFPGTFGLLNNVITGKTVPQVPRHKLNLGASWQLAAATSVNLAVSHVGSQFMDNDEANDLGTKMPAYTVANLKLEHRVRKWTLGVTVNNIANAKYYTYAVKSQFTTGVYNAYPMPERNLYASAQYRFD